MPDKENSVILNISFHKVIVYRTVLIFFQNSFEGHVIWDLDLKH